MIAAPGDRGVLFDSVRGLFLLTADDKITPLESRDGVGRFTRSLARLPWSDEVVAAGTIETVIRNDMKIQMVASSQHSELLGVFPSIRSAAVVTDFSRGPIKLIQLDGDRYRRIDTPLSRGDVAFIIDAAWFGEPLVETRRGLFLMNRDGQLAEFKLQYRGAEPPVLFSALDPITIERFQTIYIWRDGWFRIMPNREWLPVHGLPRDALVNSSLDPGAGSVLFATSKGVFAVDQEGNARNLGAGGPLDRAGFGSLARTPKDRGILAGGREGLYRIDPDTYEMQPVVHGSKDIIGAVLRITEVNYSALDIVEASNGTYALTDRGLSFIHELSAASDTSDVFVFEQLRRMLVTKRGDDARVLYDIGRRDSGGTCQRELN
jgi:hypothetical protein